MFFVQSADNLIDATEGGNATLHLIDDEAFELPSMGDGNRQ